MCFLGDGDICEIERGFSQAYSLEMSEQDRDPSTIIWTPQNSSANESHLQEITE